MSSRCCIPNCPSIVNTQNASRFIEFPKKYLPGTWAHAFRSFGPEMLKQTGRQLICPLHFPVEGKKSRKLKLQKHQSQLSFYQSKLPTRNLTPHDIELLKLRYSKINQLVSHWLCLTQQNNPGMPISDDLVIQKAKEVGIIMKWELSLDFELGWLHGFEAYLKQSDMCHWRSDPDDGGLQQGEDLREKPIVGQSADESIRSYREALEKVTQLQSYVERTNNAAAVELIVHVKQVLEKTLD